MLLPLSSFAQITDANLNLEADTIRTETHAGRNTAQRVGRMFKNIIANKWNGSFGFTTSGTTGVSTYSGGTLNIPNYQGRITLTNTGSTGVSTLVSNTLNIPDYTITLTTSGTSGAATLSAGTLNIPTYSGGATVIQTVLSIGAWDLSSTATVNVAHGLTKSKIRGITVLLLDDSGNSGPPLPFIVFGTGVNVVWVSDVGVTNVQLRCGNTGLFSGGAYIGAGNRGYIVINSIP